MKLTRQELIALRKELEKDFSHDSDLSCTSYEMADIENFVHEFAHLAVFGVQPKNVPRGDLGAFVGRCFSAYQHLRASDLSEYKAVAVELFVLEELGVEVYYSSLIFSVACGSRCRNTEKEVKELVNAWLPHPSTARRGQRLLRWLAPYIKRAKETLRLRAEVRKEKRRALVRLHHRERQQDPALRRHDE